jgi:hypothetical protein
MGQESYLGPLKQSNSSKSPIYNVQRGSVLEFSWEERPRIWENITKLDLMEIRCKGFTAMKWPGFMSSHGNSAVLLAQVGLAGHPPK